MNLSKNEFTIVKNLSDKLFAEMPKPDILLFIDRDIDDVMNKYL